MRVCCEIGVRLLEYLVGQASIDGMRFSYQDRGSCFISTKIQLIVKCLSRVKVFVFVARLMGGGGGGIGTNAPAYTALPQPNNKKPSVRNMKANLQCGQWKEFHFQLNYSIHSN